MSAPGSPIRRGAFSGVNRVRLALEAGEPTLGAFVYLRDPAVVEVLAAAGVDFVIIDAEHSARTAINIEEMIRAADACGVTPFVRLGAPDGQTIAMTLDCGAQGIMVSHFGRGGDEDVNALLRFPPAGRRGACRTVRATAYGGTSFSQYVRQSDGEVWLIGLIEDPETVEDLDGALSRSGVDVVMAGPGDLAAAYGFPGQVRHPRVVQAIERVASHVAAASPGPALAVYVQDAEEVRRWYETGVRIFVWDIDEAVLLRGFQSMRKHFDTAWGGVEPGDRGHD
jgi:2-keto-3-deoxy-L-rhamnonate aldolase RhmA